MAAATETSTRHEGITDCHAHEGRRMILGTVRRRLGRTDAQLAMRLLSQGDADEYERLAALLSDQGFDALLDDPRLLAELVNAPGGAHASLPLFCYVVV